MIQGSFVLLDRFGPIVAVERQELFYRSLDRGAAGVDGVLEFIDGESPGRLPVWLRRSRWRSLGPLEGYCMVGSNDVFPGHL